MSKKEDSLDPRIVEICAKLKQLRIERGWSSYESFAIAHDMSRQSYWKVERGQNLTLKTLFRILDIHGISLEEFVVSFDVQVNGKEEKI